MSRRTLPISLFTFVAACAICFAQAPKPPAPRWTRQELDTIDRIAQAYYESETRSVLEMLSRLVGKLNTVKIESLNRELANRKLPNAATVLIDARLSYVQQGLTKQLPKPSPRETLLLLDALDSRVTGILEAKSDNDLLPDPSTSSSSDEWVKRLWKLHVLENQLETARLMADTMARLARGYPGGLAIKLNDEQRALIQADYRQLVDKLQHAAFEVEDHEIKLRIARLKLALNRLEDPSLDTERFLAAYTSEVDSRIVSDFFERVKRGERQTASELLSTAGTMESLDTQIKRARELANDLSYKAALFYEGTHWWLRGRYGMGPDAGGLAKSAEAMQSASGQFGLYMPSDTPRPIDPTDARAKQPVPTFERRHHYWWAWEDRRLHRGTLNSSVYTKEDEHFSVTLSAFW